jgi:hypothetical protein
MKLDSVKSQTFVSFAVPYSRRYPHPCPKEQAKFEVKNRIIEIAMAVLPDTAAL